MPFNTADLPCSYVRKKWLRWAVVAAQAAENHGDEWDFTWFSNRRKFLLEPNHWIRKKQHKATRLKINSSNDKYIGREIDQKILIYVTWNTIKMHEEVDGEKSVIFTYYFGYQGHFEPFLWGQPLPLNAIHYIIILWSPTCRLPKAVYYCWVHCGINRLPFDPNFSFNPFFPSATFRFPLKSSKDPKVSSYFQGVEKRCMGNKWVNPLSYCPKNKAMKWRKAI